MKLTKEEKDIILSMVDLEIWNIENLSCLTNFNLAGILIEKESGKKFWEIENYTKVLEDVQKALNNRDKERKVTLESIKSKLTKKRSKK